MTKEPRIAQFTAIATIAAGGSQIALFITSKIERICGSEADVVAGTQPKRHRNTGISTVDWSCTSDTRPKERINEHN
jgi:hypothetical protein